MNSSDIVAALVMPVMFFVVGWIVWTVTNSRRRGKIAEIQRDIHAKLFEKFGTSQELIEYLKTDAGSKFLDSATLEQTKPFGRVLGAIQAGLILFLLGIAMLFVRLTMPGIGRDPIEHMQDAHMLLALSFLLLGLGLGFLVSAAVSYKLSKNWGLFDRETGARR